MSGWKWLRDFDGEYNTSERDVKRRAPRRRAPPVEFADQAALLDDRLQ
jgi:hypothetical protein